MSASLNKTLPSFLTTTTTTNKSDNEVDDVNINTDDNDIIIISGGLARQSACPMASGPP